MKEKEVKVSEEEQQLIFKNIRPKGMDYLVFKKVRKDLNRALKMYLGGKFKHISVVNNPILNGKIEAKGTYINNSKKRFESIGRWWERKQLNK